MASDLDIAWLAGFFDGEGCIYFAVGKDTGIIQGRCTVVNTNLVNALEIKRILSDILGKEVRWIIANSALGYRPLYTFRIKNHADTRKLLTVLHPYLRGKKPQAELMFKYLDIAPGKGTGKHYTPEHYALVNQMRLLNKRYKKGEWNATLSERLDGQLLPQTRRMKEKSELHGDMQRVTEMIAPAA